MRQSPTEETRSKVGKGILIIEDDYDVARALADVLEAEGYRVAIAANGHEALDDLRRGEPPDLILLDMMMPVMDGWKFREEQRKKPEVASIPVVTITADGNARAKAFEIGAAGYVTKPVSIDGLLDEVERVCGAPIPESEHKPSL